MNMVEKKNGFERKKLQHQGGSLAAVVSGGGPSVPTGLCCAIPRKSRVWLGYLPMDKSS
jgi:hypothetical protein